MGGGLRHEFNALPMSCKVFNVGFVCAFASTVDEDSNNSAANTACHEKSALPGNFTGPSG